ncbi:Retrovirus-related Pol polyprotein from transposon TNT 1-94 [Cucumis melo var. makuwa]|uniref:Retrovirus-related Pol polyprotein from transposon TNT 1-94 n=1 Tax=Cucumis melo var. makuwa TaxID=1194695 RepID=A0A5A7VEV8_CUCMM|nr:Retrovirus-related Pol polyprotein from transposon TNT 1-94 [Cucumis melo var. makuwa]TYK24043.1 Retrovirus-related Pol polyprotein from transposon TNT 1-94 [Cucumis melo var. makuwa]
MSKISYVAIVESLMYIMVFTRLDIAQVFGVVKSFYVEPKKTTLRDSQVLGYLRGTYSLKLIFEGGKSVLVGYIDSSDMAAGDLDNRKSNSNYLMTFVGGVFVLAIKVAKVCCTFYN